MAPASETTPRTNELVEQASRRLDGLVVGVYGGDAGQQRRLDLVDAKDVGEGVEVGLQVGDGRRRVEDGPHCGPTSHSGHIPVAFRSKRKAPRADEPESWVARASPASAVGRGISRTQEKTRAPATRSRQPVTSSTLSSSLAPATMTMLFWPLSSTWICATPEHQTQTVGFCFKVARHRFHRSGDSVILAYEMETIVALRLHLPVSFSRVMETFLVSMPSLDRASM